MPASPAYPFRFSTNVLAESGVPGLPAGSCRVRPALHVRGFDLGREFVRVFEEAEDDPLLVPQ